MILRDFLKLKYLSLAFSFIIFSIIVSVIFEFNFNEINVDSNISDTHISNGSGGINGDVHIDGDNNHIILSDNDFSESNNINDNLPSSFSASTFENNAEHHHTIYEGSSLTLFNGNFILGVIDINSNDEVKVNFNIGERSSGLIVGDYQRFQIQEKEFVLVIDEVNWIRNFIKVSIYEQ